MLAVDAIVNALKEMSKPVTTPEEIAQVRSRSWKKCLQATSFFTLQIMYCVWYRRFNFPYKGYWTRTTSSPTS